MPFDALVHVGDVGDVGDELVSLPFDALVHVGDVGDERVFFPLVEVLVIFWLIKLMPGLRETKKIFHYQIIFHLSHHDMQKSHTELS